MAPPNRQLETVQQTHKLPDPYEQEFAIRILTRGLEELAAQCEKNAVDCQKNREDIIVIKTKWGMIAFVAGLIAAAIVKLIPFH